MGQRYGYFFSKTVFSGFYISGKNAIHTEPSPSVKSSALPPYISHNHMKQLVINQKHFHKESRRAIRKKQAMFSGKVGLLFGKRTPAFFTLTRQANPSDHKSKKKERGQPSKTIPEKEKSSIPPELCMCPTPIPTTHTKNAGNASYNSPLRSKSFASSQSASISPSVMSFRGLPSRMECCST